MSLTANAPRAVKYHKICNCKLKASLNSSRKAPMHSRNVLTYQVQQIDRYFDLYHTRSRHRGLPDSLIGELALEYVIERQLLRRIAEPWLQALVPRPQNGVTDADPLATLWLQWRH